MRLFYLFFIAGVVSISAQTIYSARIKGLRINSGAEAGFPIVLLNSHPITIEFDVDNSYTEMFRVKIIHCDRNWNITQTQFVNDEFRNISRSQIPFKEAPMGVQYYRWTYSMNIPEAGNIYDQGTTYFEKLPYSGNYKFEIWNEYKNELLAEGKFFAVEQIDDSLMKVDNRYLQSEVSPKNQVNKVALSFDLSVFKNNESGPMYINNVKTVDVYKNREINCLHRIDVDDQDINTYIEGYGTNNEIFIIDNLQAGNEYRQIDLRNSDYYPPGLILQRRDGADMDRWMWQGDKDANGSSAIITGDRYSDYVQYLFELILPEEKKYNSVYTVGDFNGWKIIEQWRLQYDDRTKRYSLLAPLRRGRYDYQYVLDGKDWIALEGNDWRTVNVYTALLYYHDDRFGGFDRILLAAQGKSPGGIVATTR